jgi:hypothetical protein
MGCWIDLPQLTTKFAKNQIKRTIGVEGIHNVTQEHTSENTTAQLSGHLEHQPDRKGLCRDQCLDEQRA